MSTVISHSTSGREEEGKHRVWSIINDEFTINISRKNDVTSARLHGKQEFQRSIPSLSPSFSLEKLLANILRELYLKVCRIIMLAEFWSSVWNSKFKVSSKSIYQTDNSEACWVTRLGLSQHVTATGVSRSVENDAYCTQNICWNEVTLVFAYYSNKLLI